MSFQKANKKLKYRYVLRLALQIFKKFKQNLNLSEFLIFESNNHRSVTLTIWNKYCFKIFLQA